MSFRVTLSTPDKTYYDGDAEDLMVPGLSGYFGVLSRHAPMISAIQTGILTVHDADGEKLFVVDAGVAEVTGTLVTLLMDEVRPAADAATAGEQLDELLAAREKSVSGV